jgi:N-methylhydantoinase B
VSYRTRLLRGEGVASFMMDHGRFGPPGVLGGRPGAPNEIVVGRGGEELRPAHWSKDEDLALRPGDWVQVRTPGGGGYGDPWERDPALVARDVGRGYLPAAHAQGQYGVVLRQAKAEEDASGAAGSPLVDDEATAIRRSRSRRDP